jgi:hypothetical protein
MTAVSLDISGAAMLSASVVEYDIADVRPLAGKSKA